MARNSGTMTTNHVTTAINPVKTLCPELFFCYIFRRPKQTQMLFFFPSQWCLLCAIVYFDTRGQNGRLVHCECENAVFLHEKWANRPCGLIYRTIFFFTNSCEPELAHRLQTSKMRRNSISLDSCQHDDINIVTVSVARRRWTPPLKPRRPCVKHFTTFYGLLKHVSPKGDYFTPKVNFLRPRAIILRTGARRGLFRCLWTVRKRGFCMHV